MRFDFENLICIVKLCQIQTLCLYKYVFSGGVTLWNEHVFEIDAKSYCLH